MTLNSVSTPKLMVLGLLVAAGALCRPAGLQAAGLPAQPAALAQPTNAPATASLAPPRRLEEGEVRDLLVQALKSQEEESGDTWELYFTRPWTPITVPGGPVRAELLEPSIDRINSNPILRFELRSGNNDLGSWQVPARVRRLREVLVARGNLLRGQALSSADLVRERRDALTLHDAVFELPANPGAFELAEPLPAGAPLTARSLRLRPVMLRGQLADATVHDGALTISLKVEVLEEGVPGQLIRVRNPQSQRELRGKVLDEKTLLITL